MDTLADTYYLRAVDAYPYELEGVIESLKLALSYDSEHVGANYLMGKLYAEQLNDYARAESYYQVALAGDPRNEKVCLDYCLLIITLRDYGRAEKLIGYTRGLPGVDMASIYYLEGLVHEYHREYDSAIQSYEDALLESYNDEFTNNINSVINRVKSKKKLRKKTASV
jgi:tetratricopeptide (TPR) repeat protein